MGILPAVQKNGKKSKANGTRCKPKQSGASARNGNRTGAALFLQEDWTLFRSLTTICQKAGVHPGYLRRLIAKELVDNGLDVSRTCRIGELRGGFYVEDAGPGIDGTPEEIAWLFSIKRSLASSKKIRKPGRGALGNGLRVVVGVALASNGSIVIYTRGRCLTLTPKDSGETAVERKACDWEHGTRVEVYLGETVPADDEDDFLEWAQLAIDAAGDEPIYSKKTSPYFYDGDAFFELMQSAGNRTVQDLFDEFDGTAHITTALPVQLLTRQASSLSYEDTEAVLRKARAVTKPVDPKKFNLLGKLFSDNYAKELGTLHLAPGRGSIKAELPYTVEVWAEPSDDEDDHVTAMVNRTPVTGSMDIQRDHKQAKAAIFGCGLHHYVVVGRKPITLTLNIQIPFMPITSDGKEPNLLLFVNEIGRVVEKAAKKCQSANRPCVDQVDGILPQPLPKGRPSEEDKERFAADLKSFADRLKEINSRVDFKVSSRGWCYILENDHKLSKDKFDKAQGLINDCRKSGLLSIDFTVEDESRGAENLEKCDSEAPAQYAVKLAKWLHRWDAYSPISFWDNQAVYIQMVVEKVDLKSLFLPVCQKYCVPIINARGWSDLNLRAGLMRRFQEHEMKGRRPVLLYCGDHDPVGLQMPEKLLEHLGELEQAVGWSPRNLTIKRFGLNLDFIEEHNLTWIDGLVTGSGKDLGDPKHRMHKADFVQQYITKYGKRKVEANALVVRPEAGRKLCQDAIERYLDMDAIDKYKHSLVKQREQVRDALPEAVERFLEELEHGNGPSSDGDVEGPGE